MSDVVDQDGSCFLTAWVVSKSVFIITYDRPKLKPAKTEEYPLIPMFSENLLIGKRLFQDGTMPEKNCPFWGTLPQVPKVHSSPAEHQINYSIFILRK